jgi:uncharacterized protein (DUF1800 family)
MRKLIPPGVLSSTTHGSSSDNSNKNDVNARPGRPFRKRLQFSMSSMRSATGEIRRTMSHSKFLLAGLLLALTACGGSDDSSSSVAGAVGTSSTSTSTTQPAGATGWSSGAGSSPGTSTASPAPVPMSTTDAQRLLEQATFGPTPSEVTRVAALGYNAYITQQEAIPATGYSGFAYVPHHETTGCIYDVTAPASAASICARDNYTLYQVQRQFFENALTAPDQLRQRVAFALSQIFVVSGTEIFEAYGMAAYQNMLLNDAFANYRQLIQDVTLSPAMGRYLTMARNAKADPSVGSEPNENYARELMQLFSIGLYQLNADGSQVLDANQNPVPTYNESVVQGFAATFTGWTYAPLRGTAVNFGAGAINYQAPMISVASYHDTTDKLLLNGLRTPMGQTPEADLKLALDTVFNHPNVGPFIGKQLIQHLVTSNPSPQYVARVAAVFANNGSGVRGDLGAVVRAILGDVEARGDAPSNPDAGHLREPVLFVTTLLRGLGAQSDGVYLSSKVSAMGQPLFYPPTVFNYYPPSYQLPGTTTLAPEFFIQNAATALARNNFVNQLIFNGGATPDPTVTGSTGTTVNLNALLGSPVYSPGQLVNELNGLLMHGSLSSAAQAAIVTAVQAAPTSDPLGQVKAATYLLATSPQFQVEH